ncbi:hypothetical protein [Spongiactinospora sp. TRM90649]|uniref:hypothetical protein n=1 Tax=Spongiactinospora sp. TRM90649 TaxID=3031114 RepID=UPI0023F9C1D8|nr:hypothetical protein [Spongiactinospora sp. TRM90649]MDF5759195.1 hypothetical protein [Spongiactinospora sp. TRM90649]
MADDDSKPEQKLCVACLGEGGNWEDHNGTEDNKGRRWVTCRACGGSGGQG